MDWNIVYYILYGFLAGLGELLPVSSTAHGYLIQLMSQFDTFAPALLLSVHFACFMAVCVYNRRRIGHIRRELKIASLPANKRKRQPDMVAVLDAKVILTALIPLLIGVGLSSLAFRKLGTLPAISLLLLIGGVVLYIPQYLPGANKDSRSLSRKDALMLGISGAVGVIPGISRIGTMISVGLMKGCDRGYILDIALLASLPVLLGLMIVDCVAIAMAPAAIGLMMLLYCLLAAAAAFGGAWLAMVIMRFLSVKSNFYGFAYYNWGLALFSFLVYLMI
jgi:undecaprenyl-diphosphatase